MIGIDREGEKSDAYARALAIKYDTDGWSGSDNLVMGEMRQGLTQYWTAG